MSIAIFAILLNNTLERTHKRNTKKYLELALECLKLAELVKNGTNLLLFTAFTTFVSLYIAKHQNVESAPVDPLASTWC